jgi:aminoglycoside phosphotransferase (APT) family kinase protein
MRPSVLASAVGAAISSARELGLSVEDGIVVHNSNRIAVRLVPCDTLARVATEPHRSGTAFEVGIAQRLTDADVPVALLDPRLEPDVYVHDGFAVTFWTYYEPVSPRDVAPDEYSRTLRRMHAGMRAIDAPISHFTDRVAEAQRVVADPDRTPELGDADRRLLEATLERMTEAIGLRRAPEQLLHGEPHPGNLMRTKDGLLFVDLETCCRGPVEFDAAHVPEDVGERYPGLDQDLLRECRILMHAMVTTWRWDRYDEFPDGRRWARDGLIEVQAELDRLRLDGSP